MREVFDLLAELEGALRRLDAAMQPSAIPRPIAEALALPLDADVGAAVLAIAAVTTRAAGRAVLAGPDRLCHRCWRKGDDDADA